MIRHIGPASDFAANKPTLANEIIGAADRSYRHADIEGEITLRRQFGAGRENASGNVGFDAVGQLQVKRAFAGFKFREPICHGNNYTIAIPIESIHITIARKRVNLTSQGQ